MKINENIALAKSILKKNGIEPDSEEYKDYLKIREIVGTEYAYIGILTRLRFVDSVTDMEELKSIYDVLKNSKLDLGKLNRMSYDEILDTFYDQLNINITDEDVELVFKDNTYSYFKVKTYKGILKIGSPSWCLKTKTNWDLYQSKYPQQWVVIDNKYLKGIITPDNNYLTSYSSTKGWIRFGVSIKVNDDNTISWVANDDNNVLCEFNTTGHTFFGVLSTLLNLVKDIKKSYFERMDGCVLENNFLKVTNIKAVSDRLGFDITESENAMNYVILSKTYSYPPIVLKLNPDIPIGYILSKRDVVNYNSHIDISGNFKKIFENYALNSTDDIYSGVRLKLGKTNLEEIEEHRSGKENNKKYIGKVDKWLIFNRNAKYYLVVNSTPNKYFLPSKISRTGNNVIHYPKGDLADNTLFFFMTKDDKKSECIVSKHQEILKLIEDIELRKIEIEKVKIDTEETKPEKKVKSFWDFFRNK